MPKGEGRGDGDQGSAPNLHIGYFEMLDNASNKSGNFKPYLRTTLEGKRVKSSKSFDYKIQRYYLEPVPRRESKILDLIEKNCQNTKYTKVSQDLIDQTRPYIKIGIVTTAGTANGNVQNNNNLKPI